MTTTTLPEQTLLQRAPSQSVSVTTPRPAHRLGELSVGSSAIVRRVGGARSVARRLMEMGLLPGTPVAIARRAPLGDPIELRVRGYALSIRRCDALSVEVDPPQLP
jgi:ferrous iron transport protein A